MEDLTGMRFGRLLVIKRVANVPGTHSRWLCRCDCGVEKECLGTNLKRGISQSCGCLQRELLSLRRKTHGGWANNEKLYSVWHGMRKRCSNKNGHNYKDYGARGITVCDEWGDYSAFREWSLSHGYADGLSIDRIDVNGNYEPSNCRWTNNKVQQNNRRCCIYITYNDETHTLKEWSEIRGIKYQTLYQRYKLGWDTSRLLEYTEK